MEEKMLAKIYHRIGYVSVALTIMWAILIVVITTK
jgi:hypothetical protein